MQRILSLAIACAVLGLSDAYSLWNAPKIRPSPSRVGLRVCMTQDPSPPSSRRSFLLAASAVTVLTAQKAFAEKTIAIELSPISSTSSLDDLEAPSESANDSSRAAAKELERLRQQEEAKKNSVPRWQADLMKAQEKNKQSKKNVKNRNDLCEVLGRGC